MITGRTEGYQLSLSAQTPDCEDRRAGDEAEEWLPGLVYLASSGEARNEQRGQSQVDEEAHEVSQHGVEDPSDCRRVKSETPE